MSLEISHRIHETRELLDAAIRGDRAGNGHDLLHQRLAVVKNDLDAIVALADADAATGPPRPAEQPNLVPPAELASAASSSEAGE